MYGDVVIQKRKGKYVDPKLIQRAERMARTDEDRMRVFAVLRDEGRQLLIQAAEIGGVPATAVSQLLIETFGRSVMTAPSMRQFCGLACAAILSEAGYEVAETGVRTWKDPLFSFGSTYRRLATSTREGPTLVTRLVEIMSEAELREAEKLITARLAVLARKTPKSTD